MKKRILLTMVVVALAVATVCSFVACNGAKNELEGKVTGFDIELAEAVFEDVDGLTLKGKLIEWGSKEVELSSDKITLVWNGLTVTPEREASMQISAYYLKNQQAIVVKKENAPEAAVDVAVALGGKKVAVEDGSAGQESIAAINETLSSKAEVKAVKAQIDALLEVKTGKSDAAIIDATMAGYMLTKDYSDLAMVKINDVDTVFPPEYYGVAAKKGNTKIIGFINYRIQQLQVDGTYDELLAKYGLADRTNKVENQPEVTVEELMEELGEDKTIIIGYTNNPPMGIEE